MKQSQEDDHHVFTSYEVNDGMLDEVFDKNGKVQPHYETIYNEFKDLDSKDYKRLNEYAKVSFLNQGITYAVYNEEAKSTERIFPFDLFPRIIPSGEWDILQKGLLQRNMAINEFLKDIYNDKKIIKDKVVPKELIFSSSNYCKEMEGFRPIADIYSHICGTDLIKHSDGKYYILEDNMRNPSGVSYVLSNREAMKKTLSSLFKSFNVRTVQGYPEALLNMLQSVAPSTDEIPTCVLLTPGIYNSAYYEHAFLAQSMGIELVEGRDLFVENNYVFMKTIHGPKRVDVIYRRIDDAFLDPMTFRPDSMLGVPGLMGAYRDHNVNIVNAPGTGASDDKAVCAYVPDIIKYYFNEEPIIQNVPTYLCEREEDMKYVVDNIEKLVIKPVDMSGGYGVMIGNRLTKGQIDDLRKQIQDDPREYIAQPIMMLSLHSTFIEDAENFQPRHIDLRTFTLLGQDYDYILQGGLSRVALKKGSLVVNSSQGGGSKDTWITED